MNTDPEYRTYISKHFCEFCRRSDAIDTDGDPRVDPCHILTFGSTRKDQGNIFPACRKCHIMYEGFPSHIKELFIPLGLQYLTRYKKGPRS